MQLRLVAMAIAARPLPPASTELRVQRFRVEVVSGPDRGKAAVCTDGGELTLGTAPGCQLVLADPTVSRHHAVISGGPRGFLLRDLDSIGGTTLAGYRVDTAWLKAGAIVGVGESRIRFDALEEEIRVALAPEERCGAMLGRSAAMRALFAQVPRLGAADGPILIEGEAGTGKRLFARTLHEASPRAAQPFKVVEGRALPPGTLEQSFNGTLYIDEVADLPLETQLGLLYVLDDAAPRPFRLILSTRRDLRTAVNRGTFRPELLARLTEARLRLPPLRERREDVPLLVASFYRRVAGDLPQEPPAGLVAAFKAQDWPGNVRELRAAVEQSLGPAAQAAPEQEGPVFDPSVPFRDAKEKIINTWERAYLRELVTLTSGNLSAAARAARMDRNYLRELIQRHKLDNNGSSSNS